MSYVTDLYKYGSHEFELAPNSEGIMVSKCKKCKLAKAWLQTMDITTCKSKSIND
jgi:hypothetical protein